MLVWNSSRENPKNLDTLWVINFNLPVSFNKLPTNDIDYSFIMVECEVNSWIFEVWSFSKISIIYYYFFEILS